MIFLTVGTQLPFDRLTHAFDAWMEHHPEVEAFAQIGRTRTPPVHVRSAAFLSREELDDAMARATLVVAHAGMGTILTGLQLRKPLLVMPRVARLGEQRNDHQLATAAALGRRPNVHVARDESELPRRLDELVPAPPFEGDALGPHASPGLLEAIRRAVQGA